MTFPLEKILNISFRDYCQSQNKGLADYTLVGVSAFRNAMIRDIGDKGPSPKETLAENVPEQAEAVVSYYIVPAKSDLYFIYEVNGIALIPKTKNEKKYQ